MFYYDFGVMPNFLVNLHKQYLGDFINTFALDFCLAMC
jgi:hypothetical protein